MTSLRSNKKSTRDQDVPFHVFISYIPQLRCSCRIGWCEKLRCCDAVMKIVNVYGQSSGMNGQRHTIARANHVHDSLRRTPLKIHDGLLLQTSLELTQYHAMRWCIVDWLRLHAFTAKLSRYTLYDLRISKWLEERLKQTRYSRARALVVGVARAYSYFVIHCRRAHLGHGASFVDSLAE